MLYFDGFSLSYNIQIRAVVNLEEDTVIDEGATANSWVITNKEAK